MGFLVPLAVEAIGGLVSSLGAVDLGAAITGLATAGGILANPIVDSAIFGALTDPKNPLEGAALGGAGAGLGGIFSSALSNVPGLSSAESVIGKGLESAQSLIPSAASDVITVTGTSPSFLANIGSGLAGAAASTAGSAASSSSSKPAPQRQPNQAARTLGNEFANLALGSLFGNPSPPGASPQSNSSLFTQAASSPRGGVGGPGAGGDTPLTSSKPFSWWTPGGTGAPMASSTASPTGGPGAVMAGGPVSNVMNERQQSNVMASV